MEEFSDDFSVVLRGASLCLHHPCLRLKVFTTWVFEDTKFSAADEQDEERVSQMMRGVNLRKMMPPSSFSVNCQEKIS